MLFAELVAILPQIFHAVPAVGKPANLHAAGINEDSRRRAAGQTKPRARPKSRLGQRQMSSSFACRRKPQQRHQSAHQARTAQAELHRAHDQKTHDRCMDPGAPKRWRRGSVDRFTRADQRGKEKAPDRNQRQLDNRRQGPLPTPTGVILAREHLEKRPDFLRIQAADPPCIRDGKRQQTANQANLEQLA